MSTVRLTAQGRLTVPLLPNIVELTPTTWRVSLFTVDWTAPIPGQGIEVTWYWSRQGYGFWPERVTDPNQLAAPDYWPPTAPPPGVTPQQSQTFLFNDHPKPIQVAPRDSPEANQYPALIRVATTNINATPMYTWLWLAPWTYSPILVDSEGNPLPLTVNSASLTSLTIGTKVVVDGGGP